MLTPSRSTNLPSANADVSNPFISKLKPSASPAPAPTRRPSPPLPIGGTNDSVAGLRDGFMRMDMSRHGSAESHAGLNVSQRSDRGGQDKSRDLDRFVPSRPGSMHSHSNSSTTLPTLAMGNMSLTGETPDNSVSLDGTTSDPTTTSLSESLGIPQSGRRILSFRAAPPPSSRATSHLDAQRSYLLHSNPAVNRGVTTTGPGAQGPKKRAPPYIPDRVLDAPGFQDDYYLNLIDWSCANKVAIGLGDMGYVWDAESGSVTSLGEGSEAETPVTAVSWSNDGSYLALGLDNGSVEIWDVDEGKKLRVMGGHNARIPSLSWNGHVLSSGCRDGSIWHHDVRVAQHKVMELVGHTAEVCGLTWRADGGLLASGGNDNAVNVWELRTGQSITKNESDGTPILHPRLTKRNHTAAVKALAWCPWQNNLLATGGGSTDQTIHFWTTSTGARTHSLPTKSQVTSLIWSPHSKEILSTHGYPDNNISLWSYPALQKVYDLPAHDARVLCSTLSPDGTTVATGAGDENLKFWKVWEVPQRKKGSEEGDRDAAGRSKSAVRIR